MFFKSQDAQFRLSAFTRIILILVFPIILTVIIYSNFNNCYAQALKPSLDKITTKQSPTEETLPADNLNRRTPRGTALGYLDAMAQEQYSIAAGYLDLSYLKSSIKKKHEESIVIEFKNLLDKGGILHASALISNEYAGNPEDDLAANLENIGNLTTNEKSIPILLERVNGKDGHPIWLFSTKTLEQIDFAYDDSITIDNNTILEDILPSFLQEQKVIGGSLGQWLTVFCILIIALILSWYITVFISRIFFKFLESHISYKYHCFVHSFLIPVRMWLTVSIFIFISETIGISILIRQYLKNFEIFVYWLAFIILFWQITNILMAYIEDKMTGKKNYAALTGIEFLRKCIKISLVTIGIIVALKLNDQDVTSWLAAIGIGGIALALGAQKMVENIVGSVTVIADQPIRIGDFCKVDGELGTVIQIGIRSTRLRTLKRTIVTIPNSEFSIHKIENYSRRDTYLLQVPLHLRYETTPNQMRYVLIKVREMLSDHPKVNNDPSHPEPTRVKFIEFGTDSLIVEIYAQIMTNNYVNYIDIKQDIHLKIMDIIYESGTGFAFPSQTLYLSKDEGLSQERTLKAEQSIEQLKSNNQLPLTDFEGNT